MIVGLGQLLRLVTRFLAVFEVEVLRVHGLEFLLLDTPDCLRPEDVKDISVVL